MLYIELVTNFKCRRSDMYQSYYENSGVRPSAESTHVKCKGEHKETAIYVDSFKQEQIQIHHRYGPLLFS